MAAFRLLTATVLLTLIGLIGAAWAVPTPAYACSCAQNNPAEHIRTADVIFTGVVASDESRGDTRRITFTVDRVYKGTATATQVVETHTSTASCGLELSGGGPFVVYAQAGGGRTGLTANLCGGSGGGSVPASLGAGTAPTPDPSPAVSARTKRYGFIGIGVLCIVAAIYISRRPPNIDVPKLGTKR